MYQVLARLRKISAIWNRVEQKDTYTLHLSSSYLLWYACPSQQFVNQCQRPEITDFVSISHIVRLIVIEKYRTVEWARNQQESYKYWHVSIRNTLKSVYTLPVHVQKKTILIMFSVFVILLHSTCYQLTFKSCSYVNLFVAQPGRYSSTS